MTVAMVPYPGFSWSITQHVGPAIGDQRVMYEMLNAANIYSNSANFQDRITEYLINKNLLTPNMREGRPQAWRDYQQVLATLGLIVSTRFTRNRVSLTPIGLMWLDGIAGYSEIITTQCLRYQYPNGYNQDISQTVRDHLEENGVIIPHIRTELDASYGVQIKPAVLILRILIELYKINEPAFITQRECIVSLLALKKNNDWGIGLETIRTMRRGGSFRVDKRSLRHIQEWYRLLSFSDLFLVNDDRVELSATSIENLQIVERLCMLHESPTSFWIPTSTDPNELGVSWFRYFGAPEISSQWAAPELARNTEYVLRNYPEGVEDIEEYGGTTVREWNSDINLRMFSLDLNETTPPSLFGNVDVNRVAEGRIRQQGSARLHEKIVNLIAEKLMDRGFTVQEDPSSVDLFAFRDNNEAIIEVKTVTSRNLPHRMRLGVGQLMEYRYRRQYHNNIRPKSILALSSTIDFPDWVIGYFENDINMGLVSVTSFDTLRSHTTGDIETSLAG